MDSKFLVPKDLPAAACGRCLWWQQSDSEGWGHCLVHREKRWYKCMVCPEYEMDAHIRQVK